MAQECVRWLPGRIGPGLATDPDSVTSIAASPRRGRRYFPNSETSVLIRNRQVVLIRRRLPSRPLHRALRLGAALRARVADVIKLPGDWRGALGLHWLFAAGTSDNRQGCWRFAVHSAIPRIKAAQANWCFVALLGAPCPHLNARLRLWPLTATHSGRANFRCPGTTSLPSDYVKGFG